MNYLKISGIFLFLFLSFESFSQTANIRGFVYTKDDGEPSIFTLVFLSGTSYGVSSDVNGYYSISKVRPGNYTLMVTAIGYDTIRENISVKDNDVITKKLYLTKSSLQLKTIEISAETEAKKTEARVSVNIITPKDVNRIPSVGGTSDIAQYLQVLPGVIFTGDQGGQLYIRGGSPIENKLLLDGMIIYNPFHSIGLFSVIDMDIIRNVSVYTGGFGAQYAGRLSSIMDFTTRDGNKNRYTGKVSVSPFVGSLLFEGPLFKAKTDDGGDGSFIVSAKTSYLPTTSKIFYANADPNGLPFSFNDLYGKIALSTSNGSKLNLFACHYDDQVNYPDVANLNWTENGFGSNFVVIPNGSPVLIQGNFAYSNYNINLATPTSPGPSSSYIGGFNMGTSLTYYLNRKNTFNFGVEVVDYATNFNFYNALDYQITQQDNSSELGTYVSYKFLSKNEKLLIEPSFRLQYYASLSELSPEPRIDIKYNFSSRIRFKAAGGWYSQNLVSATSELDVVNLFYGYLSSPDNLQNTFTNQNGSVSDVTSRLQKANHIIFGFEFDLLKHLDMNIEAYRKNYTQLIVVNPFQIYDQNNAAYSSEPALLRDEFLVETGKAQGIDVTLKYDYRRFYFWLTYSLAYVNVWDGMEYYFPSYDRRNTINLVGTYTFGKDLNWELNARWTFGSGFPFTPTAGFYEQLSFNSINTNYTAANGILGILYGDINSARLPTYHRLDISIKRRIELSEHTRLELIAGATNVYDRENIFYYDRITNLRVNQLPILPSISAILTF
jgi:hypothetical protein